MSATAIKGLLLTCLLAGAVQGADHSRHNCCANSGNGWYVETDWTKSVCKTYGGTASFDQTTCNGSGINGDDFYNACKQAAAKAGFTGNAGAGYRGTCS
ncbi:hypothetical protein F52700_7435 [Fusarium sp. NRRL 52700]|nr:hypothetical protein F52700_7435 [Fusarium sp. NRRL 52700]